jgi:hypothetical protein
MIVGFAGLNRVMQSPNSATYRRVDVVRLLGSGLCFGVAMVLIIIVLRGVRI